MLARLTLAASTGMVAVLAIFAVAAEESEPAHRHDGALELSIVLDGSLQNAAWSPNGAQIVFTRFRRGYNKAPGDIMIFDLKTATLRTLIADGKSNVSQPGSTWNAPTDSIVFSSTRTDHDEIFMMKSQGGLAALKQITSDELYMSYEPSMSPDGKSVVFESHLLDDPDNGMIRQASVGSSDAEDLTMPDDDCRQPNWSPAGNAIVYQKKEDDQWDLWIYDIPAKEHRKLTEGEGDKTDATFSPDGNWVVYSADNPELRHASLFVINVRGGPPTQITNADVYDGAPSWSPDGKSIVFESISAQTATGLQGWVEGIWGHVAKLARSQPTRLWTIEVPQDVLQRLCLQGSPCP
jgi:TolB protein